MSEPVLPSSSSAAAGSDEPTGVRPPRQQRTGLTSTGVRKAASKQPRSRAREFALQALYQHQVGRNELAAIDAFTRDLAGFNKADSVHYDALLHGCVEQAGALDALLLPLLDRKATELSPIEHAVLWIGAYEMRHCLDVPWRVVLNECIELAKAFGGTDGHKYVNGRAERAGAAVARSRSRARQCGSAPAQGSARAGRGRVVSVRLAARAERIEPFYVMEVAKAARAHAAAAADAGSPMIYLNIGEPDFTAPPLVREAAERAIAAGRTQYTDALGLEALRARISGWYAERFQVDVPASRIVITAGASAALQLACLALIEAGDRNSAARPELSVQPAFRGGSRRRRRAGADQRRAAAFSSPPTRSKRTGVRARAACCSRRRRTRPAPRSIPMSWPASGRWCRRAAASC